MPLLSPVSTLAFAFLLPKFLIRLTTFAHRSFSHLKQNQTIQTLVQVYNTTQTAAYVDCSIYTLTGSNKGRALRVLGLLRLNSLPKGVALENQPYFKAGTNIILGRGTTLPLNSVYIKEVQSSSKRFEVGIFFSDDKGRKVELERNEVDRKEKVLKRKAFKKRTSVNKVIVGWKRKGVVKEIREYGVILDCGFRRDVLVHVSSAAKFFEQRIEKEDWKGLGCGVGGEVLVEVLKNDGRNVEVGILEVLGEVEEEEEGDENIVVDAKNDDDNDEIDEEGKFDEDDDLEDRFGF